jgi:hypothetical protein
MERLCWLLTLLLIAVLASIAAFAQVPASQSCSDSPPYAGTGDGCAPNVNNLNPGDFHATPFDRWLRHHRLW